REQLDRALLALADGMCAGETGGLSAPTPIRVAATGEVLRG
ncbi:tRNA threonylcarbamoyladenosine biosynthesis protein RimN, partial [Lysobacter capsici]